MASVSRRTVAMPEPAPVLLLFSTLLRAFQLGFKTAVGMPFKDIATADSIYLEEAPPLDDKAGRMVLRRMQEVR